MVVAERTLLLKLSWFGEIMESEQMVYGIYFAGSQELEGKAQMWFDQNLPSGL